MSLLSVPVYLREGAQRTRPDHLNLGDDSDVQARIVGGAGCIHEWLKADDFWTYLDQSDFGPEMVSALEGTFHGELGLAKTILATVGLPGDWPATLRKAIFRMDHILEILVANPDQFDFEKNPSTPGQILRDLFRAFAGGLTIAVTFIGLELSPVLQGDVLTTGSKAVLAAASDLTKHVPGQKAL
jgi:hypothetical protein